MCKPLEATLQSKLTLKAFSLVLQHVQGAMIKVKVAPGATLVVECGKQLKLMLVWIHYMHNDFKLSAFLPRHQELPKGDFFS